MSHSTRKKIHHQRGDARLLNQSYQDNDDVDVVNEIVTHVRLPLKLYKQFSSYLAIKFSKNEEAINNQEQKELAYVFSLGLIHAKNNLSNTSPLLHKEKIPRADVWQNLGRIAYEFLQIHTYPIIVASSLSAILNKALGNKDPRVIRDYRKTVLLYCNINELAIKKCNDPRLGELDVSLFVTLVPKQYIHPDIAATSTSSLLES